MSLPAPPADRPSKPPTGHGPTSAEQRDESALTRMTGHERRITRSGRSPVRLTSISRPPITADTCAPGADQRKSLSVIRSWARRDAGSPNRGGRAAGWLVVARTARFTSSARRQPCQLTDRLYLASAMHSQPAWQPPHDWTWPAARIPPWAGSAVNGAGAEPVLWNGALPGTESRCRWLPGSFLRSSAGGSVADGLHLRVLVQGFLVFVGCGLEVEDDLFHGSGGARFGLVGLEQHLHRYRAGRDFLGGGLLVGLHPQERVGVVQHPVVVDPQPETADEVGVGHQHPLGAGLGHVKFGLDGVGPPEDAGHHAALDVLHIAGERQPGDGGQRRQDAEEDREPPE